ncbi:MAG: hypothetical protein WED83_01750 [Acidimicrobiia bacterium]
MVTAPVAPTSVKDRLVREANEVIVVETPEPFFAIGQFYIDFTQTSDAEVTEWLDRARGELKWQEIPFGGLVGDAKIG